mgnify:FL=1
MTHAELETLLAAVGLPVAYHHFDAPPTAPFLVYLDSASGPFYADDRTYAESRGYRLELYGAMDLETEADRVRSVLDAASIPYTVDHSYVESEALFEVIFEIEV